MKLTVLGCQSPFPGPGGATSGYLLQTEQGNILIDAGSGVVSQLQKSVPIEAIDAVILSHLHEDHISDMGMLQYAYMVYRKMGKVESLLPVYYPKHSLPEQAARLLYDSAVDLHPIDARDTLDISGLKISFQLTQHSIPCFAMRFVEGENVLVYGADGGQGSGYETFAKDADLFICEATYNSSVPESKRIQGHLSNVQAAQIANQARCKKLLLTHWYPSYDLVQYNQEAAPYFQGELAVAEVGHIHHV